MLSIGYIFRPSVLPLETDRDRLHHAGAIEIYCDRDERLHYAELRSQSQQGEIDQLLLLELADLGDSVVEIGQRLQEWERANVAVRVVTKTGIEEASDRETLLRWVSELPGQLRSRQVAVGHARSRLMKKAPPGRPPFGYKRDRDSYILDRRSAAIVREYFDRFLLYGSLRDAVRHVRRTFGKTMSVATGRRWLTQAAYRGDLAYKDGATLRDTHPAILTRDEAAQIDRWLRRNRSIAPRSASAPRSLAGLVFCQTCEQSLRVVQVTQRRKAKHYLYLRCDRCGYSLNYDRTLTQVIRQVCADLPQRVATFDGDRISQAKQSIAKQIEKNDSILNTLTELERDGVLDAETVQLRRYRLAAETAQLQQQLEQFPPASLADISATVSIEPFWRDLTESERRRYFREFIRRIAIAPEVSPEIQFFF